jgi:beta-N-acetylglucosaminidase
MSFTNDLKVKINQQFLQFLSLKKKKNIEVNNINNTIYEGMSLLSYQRAVCIVFLHAAV